MTTESNSEARVGFGHPPQSGKFKPGKSGNPKGRPKKSRTAAFAAAIATTLNETVKVTEGGKTVHLTRMQIGVRKLVLGAAKGDLRALKELLKLRDAKENVASPDAERLYLGLDEAAAGGPLDEVLNSPTTVVVRLPADPVEAQEAFVRYRWPHRVEKLLGKAALPSKVKAPKSLKALIEHELERRAWLNNAATGKRTRMSMREAIATQLSHAFAAGKSGASDLLLRLNKPSEGGMDTRWYVLVDHDYVIPPAPNKN